jgi:hypothetical protein
MPTVVRYFIKTGLIFLVLSLLLGTIMAAQPVVSLPNVLSSLFPTYIHLFVVGWVTQIIFGVSIWMFPSPEAGGRYGNETILWSVYGSINAGLLLRLLAEPGNLIYPNSGIMDVGLAGSALLQWVSALLYVYHIWERVKGK